MVLKGEFPPTPSQTIQAFAGGDLAEGADIGVYYPVITNNEDTDDYQLSSKVHYGHTLVVTGVTPDSASFTKQVDLDFDMSPMTYPKKVQGTLRATFSMGSGGTAGTNDGEFYVVLKLRKWDGTTETELADGQSYTQGVPAGASKTAKTTHITIDASDGYDFGFGETLRITLELWAKKTNDGGQAIRVAVDPKDATNADFNSNGALTTQFVINIPFDADIR